MEIRICYTVVIGAPLPIVGQTKLVILEWGHVNCIMSFLVLGGLEGVTGILGMDALGALRVLTDTEERTTNPGPLPLQDQRKCFSQTQETRRKQRSSCRFPLAKNSTPRQLRPQSLPATSSPKDQLRHQRCPCAECTLPLSRVPWNPQRPLPYQCNLPSSMGKYQSHLYR